MPTGTSPYRIPPKAPGLREDVFIVLATDTNGEAAASVLKIDDPTISPPTTSAPGLARFQNRFRGYLNLTSPADIFGSGAIVPPSHYDTTHTHNTHIHIHTYTHNTLSGPVMIEVWAKLPDQGGVLRICFRPTRNDVTCICEIDSLGPGIICERNT